MMRLALYLLALSLMVPSLALGVTRREPERPDRIDYRPEWANSFPGAPNTLPYGQLGHDSAAVAVLNHAYTMGCVQEGITKMQQLGYVRTPAYDAAFTKTGYSCVILAFQSGQPDHDLEQPSLIVITQPFEIPNVGWRPATQAYAGTVRDSSGTILMHEMSETFFIQGTLQEPTLTAQRIRGALQAQTGALLPGAPPYVNFTAFDEMAYNAAAQTWLWWTTSSPAIRNMFKNYCRHVTAGAGTGTMAGAYTGKTWQSAGVGALIGASTASLNFWADPDTTAYP